MDSSHIQFCDRKSRIDLSQLQALFKLGAFWAHERSVEDLSIAIANSEPVVSVWDGERLIGFARATSDGIYRATVWDVVIDPDYLSWCWARPQVSRDRFESSPNEPGGARLSNDYPSAAVL